MPARLCTALILLTLASCARNTSPPVSSAMIGPPPRPHPDYRIPREQQTAIGDVRAIDPASGTITVAMTTGAKSEQAGLGRLERLSASAEQRASVHVGEVIEFRYRLARPYPALLSVAKHVHGEPLLPPER